jgi:hypothetical protein
VSKRSFSFIAIGLGALFAATSIVPAQAAMPMPQQQQLERTTDVVTVKSEKKRIIRHKRAGKANRGWKNSRGSKHHRSHYRTHAYRGNSYRNHSYHNYHNRGYRTWNGYRGYGYHRAGYRYYGGYWYPAAAFVVVAPRVVVRGSMSHARWCENRYVSYRVSDNTYQPYDGPRRQCVSP